RAAGVDPYPPGFARTNGCGSVRAAHAGLAPDRATGEQVAVAGRIVLLRDHGKLWFATLRDWSGDLQVMLTKEVLDDWASTVDIGDHVGVTGEVITTRRGEVSVRAHTWTLTAKCLHPLPDKHRGLAGEALVRQRHLDLIVNSSARELLRVRSVAVHAVRTTLVERGFLEVETPILQRIHGGANARPFRTHINAYDLPLYLRIAPELYLKRLAVGGVESVFELGRDFRNEGADATHNPEFTMLEAYQAYADYTVMRTLTRDLIIAAARAAYGRPVARRGDVEVDLDGEWPVIPVHGAVSTALGEEIDPGTSLDRLRTLAHAAAVPVDPGWGRGALVLEMYERLVEEHTVTPTFYTDFPTDVSPLTRAHRDDPRLAERWDLVAFGMELGTAYTELIDPVEQRRRLTEQSLRAAGGDPEAMELDEDFLRALEFAMPPTGGMGMGIDRLVMLLTGRSIRETLPFPLVKPR
ncbi:MAG: lysine--tRNA ligase, partial [Actinobacteria bacterium 13_2_20CM_2_71_6]